jgi:hypothetical protein
VQRHPFWHQPLPDELPPEVAAKVPKRPPDWELVDQCRISSPLRVLVSGEGGGAAGGVDGRQSLSDVIAGRLSEENVRDAELARTGKDTDVKVQAAIDVANRMAMAEMKDEDGGDASDGRPNNHLDGWDFVSPEALAQEYIDQMSSVVSAF